MDIQPFKVWIHSQNYDNLKTCNCGYSQQNILTNHIIHVINNISLNNSRIARFNSIDVLKCSLDTLVLDIDNNHTEDEHAWINPKRLAQLMSEVEFELPPISYVQEMGGSS